MTRKLSAALAAAAVLAVTAAVVLRATRSIEAPIFLYSGLDEGELARRAEEADLEGYICKWIGIERVVERVKDILRESVH